MTRKLWVQLDDTNFDLDSIVAVRDAGDGHTSLWTIGQSATDGNFLLDVPYDEVMDKLEDAEMMRLASQLETERILENGGSNIGATPTVNEGDDGDSASDSDGDGANPSDEDFVTAFLNVRNLEN